MQSTHKTVSASPSTSNAQALPKDANSMRWSIWVGVALIFLTVAVFWPVRRAQFINYDDQDYVTANTTVQKGVTWSSVVWAFTTHHASNWHPLTWLSHMLDCQMFGLDAGWHHIINLLLHVANTLLLFALLRRLTGALWRSAMVAVLFAIHPMHVESVAWVAERKDVLSTFFAFSSLIFYSRYVGISAGKGIDTSQSFRVANYCFAFVTFILGLLAKPMIVTLPFVMLLLDVWPLARTGTGEANRQSVGRLLVEKIPFFLVSVASCVITVWAQKNGGALKSVADAPLTLRLENSIVSYALYLLKLLVPIKLAIFYPQPDSYSVMQVAGALLLIVGVSIVIFLRRKSSPWMAVGWCWFIGTLVPVLGIVKVGVQSMADRYSYFPSIGLFMAIVWGVWSAAQRLKAPRGLLASISGVAVGCLAVACSIQVGYWKNSETLFRHALEVTSGNFIAHLSLGTVLADRENIDEAEPHFRTAIELHHRFPEAHHNLGNVLMLRGKVEEGRGNMAKARDYFEQAKAAYAEAIRQKADYASAQENLALVCVKLESWQEAAEHFAIATELTPDNATAHFNFGIVWTKLGDSEKAIEEFNRALQDNSAFPQAHFQLGSVLYARNKAADALIHFRAALQQLPEDVETLNRVAWIESSHPDAVIRNGAEAVQLASRAVNLTHENDARSLSILAMAFAESGDFKNAVMTAEKGRSVAIASGQVQAAQSIEAKLDLYRRGRPFRQAASR